MGFLKKVVKAVTAPVVAPVAASVKALDKVGATATVKNAVGVDLNNLSTVVQQSGKLEGSTGSDQFKTALFDAGKIGIATAGGAGLVSGTTAAGGFLLASKAQQGGGVSLGDLGTLAGIPTSFGGIDFGGMNVVKPKTIQPISEVIQDWLPSDYYGSSSGETSSGVNLAIIAPIVIFFLGGLYFILRKKR